ncbi:phosphohydrolase [Herbiconiux sp. VKM Ac-2851]|uniref:phosphohydrolase n=1 Tax=Herbiconiux sp. VKM Ac-2851 TaxID=2739025 RepID=UPI0015654307|nr:phosphohydrolase [Herbiconiux sp. VKM Ac-2851]NQX36280.1 phosphohydrolase [Herbiconiux sp. VKM Ac-2851]
MQTWSGGRFFPMDPNPDDINPDDIAHALGMLCRYNGHVDQFYSVAEHCLHLSYMVSPENALWALLHDATEAYVGDMIRPLKQHMPDYVAAENRVMWAICDKYGLDRKMPAQVREYDTRILLNERERFITRAPGGDWGNDDLEPLPGLGFFAYGPADAARTWLRRLEHLTGVNRQDVYGEDDLAFTTAHHLKGNR